MAADDLTTTISVSAPDGLKFKVFGFKYVYKCM